MSQDTYVGAIDQGTTGTRFMVFDGAGQVVADAYERHEQHYPNPGWVEHDAVELWENTKTVICRGLRDAGLDATALAALGVANQRETTVCWEPGDGEPIANAIVWQDRRTADRIEQLDAAGETDWIRSRTGLEPDAYFSATKAEWLLHASADSGNRHARAAAGDLLLGTIDAWLVWNLTGEHVTDVTNASRTMLVDVERGEWDDELLAEFGVPRAALPAIRPSSEDRYGATDPDGFLGAAVPVTAALGDQQAALFGQACFDPGETKSTTGTGSFLLCNTGEDPVRSDHGLLTTVAYQRAGEPLTYALEGSIFVTGGALEWLAEVGVVESPAETATLASAVDGTDGVYFVPAFQGLGAPDWDGRARGTMVGLTRGTDRRHIARAALEAIGYRTRDVLEAMTADAGLEVPALRVDGGAVENDVLCQLQADILGTPILRPVVDETTALGAAYAAGLAVGVWDSLDALRDHWRLDARFEPTGSTGEYERWRAAVDRSREWATGE